MTLTIEQAERLESRELRRELARVVAHTNVRPALVRKDLESIIGAKIDKATNQMIINFENASLGLMILRVSPPENYNLGFIPLELDSYQFELTVKGITGLGHNKAVEEAQGLLRSYFRQLGNSRFNNRYSGRIQYRIE